MIAAPFPGAKFVLAFHLFLIGLAPLWLLPLRSRELAPDEDSKLLLIRSLERIPLFSKPLQQVECFTGEQVFLVYQDSVSCALKVHR